VNLINLSNRIRRIIPGFYQVKKSLTAAFFSRSVLGFCLVLTQPELMAQSDLSAVIGSARDYADMNRVLNLTLTTSNLPDGDLDERRLNMQAFPNWIRTGWLSCSVRATNRSGQRIGEVRCVRNDQFVASVSCSRYTPRSSMTLSDPDNLYRFYLTVQCR